MMCLVRINRRRVLKGEADVVESFQKAVAGEFIDGEQGLESGAVVNSASFQINSKSVVLNLRRPAGDFGSLIFSQHHRQDAILYAIVGKDVGERRRDHGAKTEIRQCPYRVLAR